MTTTTEKKAEPPKKIEKTTDQYSCQIVLEKTTKDKQMIGVFLVMPLTSHTLWRVRNI